MPDPARQAAIERARQTAKYQRHRQRQAGLLGPVPRCERCGGRILQQQPQPDLCSSCWRLTPDGQEATRERMREARQRWRL